MRQYAGFATAEETNRRYKYLLEQGQTGLSVAFDLPTQIGYDSDHPLAEGEVGKVGVAIDTLRDVEILFDGIPIDKVSTSMTINSTAAILLTMYIAMAEKQGVTPGVLQGTIQNDILKEYAARGTYIYPPFESMRIVTDIFAYSKDHLPRWNTINISGYHMRGQGVRPSRKSPLPSPMALPMWKQRSGQALMSIPLPPGSPSFSAVITPFSKKLPSSGLPGGSGPRS
jgi:methylmalonyl-CoA mutase N-terminal domain/subunit